MAEKKKRKQNYNNVKSTHPVLCPDGKYRWVFDVPMLKNPTILFDVYWVLIISFGIVYLFVLLIGICTGSISWEITWGMTKTFVMLTAGMLVLGWVAYFFVSWFYGWKYSVLFIMDEKEVVHKTMKNMQQKARVIGKLTMMAGAASGKPGMVGMGMIAANRTSMSTDLSSVRRLIPCRRWNLIKVNERFSRNRVFVADEDFDFVYDFLRQHCPLSATKDKNT